MGKFLDLVVTYKNDKAAAFNTCKCLIMCLLAIVYQSVFAQISLHETKPDLLYNSISNNLINPAAYDSLDFVSAAFSFQNRFGAFQKVRDMNAFGQISISPKSKLTTEIYSTQNGPFIRKNRFYLGYNTTISISKETQLAAGANLGYNSILLVSNTASNGGSGGAVDGSLGIRLITNGFDFGASYLQFLEPIITPINYSYNFAPYYEFYTSKCIELPSDQIIFKARLKWVDAISYQSYSTIQYNIKSYATVATTYSPTNFVSVLAGVKPMLTEGVGLQLYASYTLSLSKTIEQNLLELNVLVSLP